MVAEKRDGIEERKEASKFSPKIISQEEETKKRKRSSPEQLEAMLNEALAKQSIFEEQEELDIQDLGQFNQKGESDSSLSG